MTGLLTQLAELAASAQAMADADDNGGAQHCIDQALALAPGGFPVHPASVMLGVVATTLAHRRGDAAEATRHAVSAVAIAGTLGDSRLKAWAQLALARACLTAGDNDQTVAALEAAWPQARDGHDLDLRSWCQTVLGIVHKEIGDFAAAIDWFRQAQATAVAAGLDRLVALTAANLAAPWLGMGDAADARGDRQAAVDAWQAALEAADVALPLVTRVGVVRWRQVAMINRSAALVSLGRDAEALDGLVEGDRLAIQSGTASDRVLVALYRVRLLRRRGEFAAACAEASRGLAIGEASDTSNALIDLYEAASDVAERCGDLATALAHSRRQHALHMAVASDSAALRSKVLAVRLATERAQAEALAAGARALVLHEANLALEQQAEMLQRQALQDPLTGLANRRQLDRRLAQAHADAVAQNTPLCVLMLDIDHFKLINDHHSHATGDRVLQQLGRLLAASCRAHDLAARYGGEEFVILLPGLSLAQAALMSERLRRSIEAFDWSTLVPQLAVTASIGVCDIATNPDPDSGLAVADALLYRAKRKGRNRVISIDASAPMPL